MMRSDFFSINIRETIADDKKIKADIRIQMIFRYGIIGFAVPFLYLFRNQLPFPFPHFFLVAVASLVSNTALHAITMSGKWRKRVYGLFPYIDAAMAAPVFLFSGGFLSPFVITHIATNIGSVIVYTENRSLAKHAFLMLFVSYIGVALLQKAGITQAHIEYVGTMLHSDFFFSFVVIITSLIMVASYFLIHALNFRVHQMLDEMGAAFSSIVTGTNPVVGKDFFIHLAKSCVETLHVETVICGELVKKGQIMKVLARAGNDGKIECGQEVAVANTLFGEILSRGEVSMESGDGSNDAAQWLTVGSDRWSLFGIALRDSTGKPIGIFCQINNGPLPRRYLVEPIVSIFTSRAAAELERKIAEDRRNQIEQQLAQAHKMGALGQLASGIAHDFNNMLGVITGYSSMLVNKIEKTSPQHRVAAQILTTARTATEMIGSLSRFIRKEAIELSPLDVNEVVTETVAFLERTIVRNITLVKKLAANPAMVMGDRTLLQNVFMNLAINARDAMENKKGAITFTTGNGRLSAESALCATFHIEPGAYVTVEVADAGSGMSGEVLSHLFEPFFTTKGKNKGTGLGLANVWGYIENYKGAVEVKSEVGRGSSFLLYLPEKKESAGAAA
jgi:signal transduction histidine kinase